MKKVLAVGILVAAFAHSTSFAQSSSANQPGTQDTNRQQAQPAAPIKSERDLYEHLVRASNSPLHRLPPSIKWEFIGSLVFTDKGLGGFRYDFLALLKPTDSRRLLSLFGIQDTASMFDRANGESEAEGLPGATIHPNSARDYLMDYECVSRATCKESLGYVCVTRNC